MEETPKTKKEAIGFTGIWLKRFLIIGGFLLLAGTAKSVQAANLYFYPASGDYKSVSTFAVTVYVGSADQAMNAGSGVVVFPQDKLEVTGVSKTGSIFNLWVQEPSFSNAGGTVNFEGIVLNPGFTGGGGKIVTINFKVKAGGTADLSFFSASVLANDGKGTNILSGLGSASFNLGGGAVVPPVNPTEEAPPAVASSVKPAAPNVSSATHPDSDQWSNNNNPTFTWSLTKDITGVSIYSDQNPNTNPGAVSDGLFTSQTYKNVKDGIWYFHIRLKNNQGWGPATHYRYQIDTQPPNSFQIDFPHGNKTEDPVPIINFNTTDGLSGIGHYLIKVGDQDFIKITTEQIQSNPYALPQQEPGQKVVLVRAVDKAGNFSQATAELTITALKAPVITDYTKDLTEQDFLRIMGVTYPDIEVAIFLTDEDGEIRKEVTKSDASGNFTIAWPRRLSGGDYSFTAQAVDVRGAKSELSEKITFEAKKAKWLERGTSLVAFLSVIVSLAALIVVLVFIVLRGWRKFSAYRGKTTKKASQIQCGLRKAVGSLEKDVAVFLDLLEKARSKRRLTAEERKMVSEFKKHLNKIKKL